MQKFFLGESKHEKALKKKKAKVREEKKLEKE